MKNNVTSLEVSKKLKEAGFKKESKFFNLPASDRIVSEPHSAYWSKCLRRYQVNEILEELPIKIDSKNEQETEFFLEIWLGLDRKVFCDFLSDTGDGARISISYGSSLKKADTMQDALALMLIWLLKNGYMKEGLK